MICISINSIILSEPNNTRGKKVVAMAAEIKRQLQLEVHTDFISQDVIVGYI